MSDQCRHCTLRGQNVNRCHSEGEGTPCSQAESWYGRALREQRDDLYEALKMWLPFMEAHTVSTHMMDGLFKRKQNEWDDKLAQARAALKKAEGQG